MNFNAGYVKVSCFTSFAKINSSLKTNSDLLLIFAHSLIELTNVINLIKNHLFTLRLQLFVIFSARNFTKNMLYQAIASNFQA